MNQQATFTPAALYAGVSRDRQDVEIARSAYVPGLTGFGFRRNLD